MFSNLCFDFFINLRVIWKYTISFQTFCEFQVMFILLISNLTPYGHRIYFVWFESFWKFTEACFVAQNMVYLSKCSVYTYKWRIFCCCWMEDSTRKCELRSSWLTVFLKPFISLLIVSIFVYELSLTVIVYSSIYPWSPISFCFMYFKVLLLDV